jgi:dTDP-4-dehydrorhamnose reductase
VARVAVLGANGMLGHMASLRLAGMHEVVAIVRRGPDALSRLPLRASVITGIDVREPAAVRAVLHRQRPDVVLNCIGLIKQRPEAKDTALAIELNALLPHRLAADCAGIGAKLIQISTDCVFSGRRGNYSEADEPDPIDSYGRTKLLGEITDPPHLTLRTSIIGPQLEGNEGLVAWFLSQAGRPVKGYRRAIFSGLTTSALADVLDRIIAEQPALSGLYHVASRPIAKFDLLAGLATRIGWSSAIEPVDLPLIDRSLDGRRFLAATGIEVPAWDDMLDELTDWMMMKAA